MRFTSQLVACLSMLFGVVGAAQAQTSFVGAPTTSAPNDVEQEALGFTQGSFVAVPIPSQNPTFETGLALGAGYLFKADEESSNSFFGIGVYGSTNGSRAYGFSTSLSFLENRWKVGLTLAEVDLNYDLFLVGLRLPLNQTGRFGSAELSYGITSDLSVGVGARYVSTTIVPAFATGIPPEFVPDFNTEIVSGGLIVNWDRRDDTFYSTDGTKLSFNAYHHDITDDPRDYQKAVLTADGYLPIRDAGVIAGRFTACKATEEAPFFDACALGAVDSFRGFSFAENIGEELASVQLSWRGRFGASSFGYEIFAGAGRVYKVFPGLEESKVRSAGGVGVRYRLTEKFPLDIALDVAVNDAGKRTSYIYVGQRF